jgi:hypothetical protein
MLEEEFQYEFRACSKNLMVREHSMYDWTRIVYPKSKLWTFASWSFVASLVEQWKVTLLGVREYPETFLTMSVVETPGIQVQLAVHSHDHCDRWVQLTGEHTESCLVMTCLV